jgi:thiamine-phosphate pyrophosphorylase
MSELENAYRILDASANRASEGLRTMEEYARFALNDARLAGELKSLRHDLAETLAVFPREKLLSARDTVGDVGTNVRESAEYHRSRLTDVIGAASSRVQQSLRVLEEYGKVIDPNVSQRIEQLRYRSYTVCAELELRSAGKDLRSKLDQAHLYVLIDAAADAQSFEDLVTQLVRSEIDILQLRDRSVDDRTLWLRAKRGAEITRQHGKLFIMNDRADLAVAADTDGVHVGQDELPVAEARRIVGPERLVGLSTHSIQEAREAVREGADYIGCGPVFPGQTKQFESYVGTELLRQVAAEIDLPAFAIGGITATNVDQVVAAGFCRIAVTGAIRDAADPVAAAGALRKAMTADQVSTEANR